MSSGSAVAPVILGMVGLAVTGGAAAMALLMGSSSSTHASSSSVGAALAKVAGAVSPEARFYFSDHPLLADVNHDGVMDVVGKSSVPSQTAWIAAYDGKDGKQLWRTTDMTKDASEGMSLRAIAGNRVISIDALGKIQAYDLGTGQPAWAALLGERARGEVCAGDEFVRIKAQDDSAHDIDLGSGKPATVAKNAACSSVASSMSADGNGYRVLDWADFEENGLPSLHSLDAMSAYRAILPDSGGMAFMLGTKPKGTEVAMITAVEHKKAVWQSLVPAVDPMTTSVNVLTQIAAYDSGRVAVPYNMDKHDDGVRMACFDAKTGRRLWDVQVHKKTQVNGGIAMTARDVYFSSWTALYVLRADTGELRYTVGTEF